MAQPLRWLLVGTSAAGSLEGMYGRALRASGCDVELFDTERYQLPPLGNPWVQRVARRLATPALRLACEDGLQRFVRHSRRYDVIQVVKGMEFRRETLERCRRHQPDALWINYNADDPFNLASRGSTNERVLESLTFYDIYFSYSQSLVERMRAHGCRRAEQLAFGFDREIHPEPRPGLVPSDDRVCFVGAWDRQREQTLGALRGLNLRIYGTDWDRAARSSGLGPHVVPRALYGRELTDVLSGSAVCLNILRPQNYGSHNMRTFEIPAMGGLQLTTRTEEQARFFPEGEACFMYERVEELRDKIVDILADRESANRVRARGRQLVEGHSYRARAEQLVSTVRETVRSRN